MNVKILVLFVICAKAIIYLWLYDLHGCTFNIFHQAKFSEEDLYFFGVWLKLEIVIFIYLKLNRSTVFEIFQIYRKKSSTCVLI